MGDMADFSLYMVYDYEELHSTYRMGSMGAIDAYELGLIDELGFEIKGVPLKTCKFCNKSRLHWDISNDKWRLFDGRGVHICPVNPLVERKSNEQSTK